MYYLLDAMNIRQLIIFSFLMQIANPYITKISKNTVVEPWLFILQRATCGVTVWYDYMA